MALTVAVLGGLARTAGGGEFTVFGPEDYARAGTKPVVVSATFTVRNPDASYALHIDNGGRGGQFARRVSSAVITVNGIEVVGPNDFNQNVGHLDRPLVLAGENEIAVELRSAPGSGLTLEIIGVDEDPPVITATLVPPANAAGWNATAVTVMFQCWDLTSGIATCPGPEVLETEGAGQVVTGTAVDMVGNRASTSVTVNIDWTPPTIVASAAPSPNAAGWNNTAVGVDFECADSGSGIASCTGPLSVATEGADQVISGTAVDLAGNSATDAVTLSIDVTPPSITPTLDPPANAAGWNSSAVTVSFDCADGLSGVEVCPDAAVVDSEGEGVGVTGTASDVAGNTGTATVSVNLDMTPPGLVIDEPADGSWLKVSPVSVMGIAEDPLSGIDTMTCNGDPVFSSPPHICDVALGSGHHAIDIEVTDLAGNETSVTLAVTSCRDALEVAPTESFTMIWNDRGSGAHRDGAFYRPEAPPELAGMGYHALGHFGQGNYNTPSGFMMLARERTTGALAEPVGFANIWKDRGSGADLDGAFWSPVPPAGYLCLGVVATRYWSPPPTDVVRCVKEELVAPGAVGSRIWIDAGSGADRDFGSWAIIPDPSDVNGLDVGAFTGRSYAFGTGYAPPTDPLFVLDARWVSGPGELTIAEIEELIQEYGPAIQLSEHEQYFMDDPEVVLNDPDISLAWALVRNEWNYDTMELEELDSRWTSSATLVADAEEIADLGGFPPYDNDPDFRYWLQVPEALKPGELGRARTFVHVRGNPVATEIQFWLFYPFNGPGRVLICHALLHGPWNCEENQLAETGRHYGDWEMVSLTVDNASKQPLFVTLSQHGRGERIAYSDVELWAGTAHPLLYAAKFSHANYASAGRHDYELLTYVDKTVYEYKAELYDRTDAAGPVFLTWESYVLTTGDTCDRDHLCVPDWLRFAKRWGQYEWLYDDVYHTLPFVGREKVYTYTEVGAGPTGPAMKTEW